MATITSVTVAGNLTRDPEIRHNREGQATTSLSVAVNRRWQDKSTKESEESVSFLDVICWRDLAENVAISLTKGSRVLISGRLEQRSWETDGGERRSKVEILADDIGGNVRFATTEVHQAPRHAADNDQGGEPTPI